MDFKKLYGIITNEKGESALNFEEKIDIKENNLLKLDSRLVEILLKDNTTKKNIIWATDNYKGFGNTYYFSKNMTLEAITGLKGNVIKPRVEKTKKEQQTRIREKAEVFTPSWICNKQNNLIDESWFEDKNIFNVEKDNIWKTNSNKITFPTKSGKTWQDYINDNRLEVACGEAPYLVSRYDTVSGNVIEVKDRIGLLDRKLRIIDENTSTEEEWLEWSTKAYKSIYGYDWQGDNVLLARENLLYTFQDYYFEKFNKEASLDILIEIANIISWNIWQMDGIKLVIPNSCKTEEKIQMSFFGDEVQKIECLGCKKNNFRKHNGIYSKIMNWETNRAIKFLTLIERSGK